MRKNGPTGPARIGGGVLTRAFNIYTANFLRSPETGWRMKTTCVNPDVSFSTADFSTGLSETLPDAVPVLPDPKTEYAGFSPLYEMMKQQQAFLAQQQAFQTQQFSMNKDQSGLIQDMMMNFTTMFTSAMETLGKMAEINAAQTPAPIQVPVVQVEPSPANDPSAFQSPAYGDNVVNIKKGNNTVN